MGKIKSWWATRTPALRASVNTAWQAFGGVFGLALLGWLSDVQDWAGGGSEAFPGLDVVGKAAVSGAAGAAAAIIAYVFRRVKPPSFDPAKQPVVQSG